MASTSNANNAGFAASFTAVLAVAGVVLLSEFLSLDGNNVGSLALLRRVVLRDAHSVAERTVQCDGYARNGSSYALSMQDYLGQATNASLAACDPTFRPSNTVANMTKPVQVYILLGQSNMVGMADVYGNHDGTLEYAVKTKKRFQHLVDRYGNWTVRHDVRYVYINGEPAKAKLHNNEWLTVSGSKFGPEIQFGYVMAELSDAPVLLLKSCIGNRALGWDLLPPGSQRFVYNGTVYAAYGESPAFWKEGTPKPNPDGWYAGKDYDMDLQNAKNILGDLTKYYPFSQDGHYEIAGFVWWQGDRDRRTHAYALYYEDHLVHLIKQLRKDFGAPDAKFVLATIGMRGYNMKGDTLMVAEAQLNVSGDRGKYPEFEGNVLSMDIRSSYRDGPADFHYGMNADTYMEVGNSLGLGMAKLLFG